jgi:hypothetical protein
VARVLGPGLAREPVRVQELALAQVQELAREPVPVQVQALALALAQELALGPVQGHRQPGADWAGSYRLRRSRLACLPRSTRGIRFECAGDRRSIGLCLSLESAFGQDAAKRGVSEFAYA